MTTQTVLKQISTNEENIKKSESPKEDQTEKKCVRVPVAYIYNDSLLKICDNLPKIPKRAGVVHSLIQAYGLLEQMLVISPIPATEEEILTFHSSDYMACVSRLSSREDDEKYDEDDELFGLTYDCPAFPGCHDYGCYVTGASLRAAECLVSGTADVAINWTGGWHHAKRDAASGYCYYNDIVVAILRLRQKFQRVLYVDIDLHHGDGVEDAFSVTHKVMTVSFHKYSPGFFPCTGDVDNIGYSKGRYHTVNVPLRDGIQDTQYIHIFKRIMATVRGCYKPDVLVVQCGADGLTGDPMDSFNLTPTTYVECVAYLHTWKLPMMLLGGGGYHTPNTARCWTHVTAAVLAHTLDSDIPEHMYFPLYGPDYDITLMPGNRPNNNSTDYIESVISTVTGNMEKISSLA